MAFVPIITGPLGAVAKWLLVTEGLGNKRASGGHPNYYTTEISQNTERSPGDLRRLAVTQTSGKNKGEHYTIRDWCFCNRHQRIIKRTEDLEIGRRVETIQTTALLRTTRLLRRVRETWEDLLSLKVQWKTIS